MAKNPSNPQAKLRHMTSSDLDQVIEIDRVSFPTPWPEEAFEYELRH